MSQLIILAPGFPVQEVSKLRSFVFRDKEISALVADTLVLLLPKPLERRYRGVAWLEPLAAPKGIRGHMRYWRGRGSPQFVISVEMGPEPHLYPNNNLTLNQHWIQAELPVSVTKNLVYRIGPDGVILQLDHEEMIPYGGKSSPIIVHQSWQELFIAILAHETWHLRQEVYGEDQAESPCELYALRRLLEYRERYDWQYLQTA